MKVILIACTASELDPWTGLPGKAEGSAFQVRIERDQITPEEVIEFAGRLCYESWDLPREETATQEGYIANLLKQGHESVFEHASATFYVEGVSRNLSHELIRHRHLSFSELSQRFVDMSDAQVVIPPALKELHPDSVWDTNLPVDEMCDYSGVVTDLIKFGKTRKQAREAARAVLPSSMETKFVVTGNLRAWRDVLKKRDSEHADAEMQLFAKELKRLLKERFPNSFRDL